MNADRLQRYLNLDDGCIPLDRHISRQFRFFSASNAMSQESASETTVAPSAGGTASAASSGSSSPVAGAGASQIVSGGNLSVTESSDPAVIGASLNTIQSLVQSALNTTSGVASGATSATAADTNNLSQLLDQVLANDSQITANSADGGQTNTDSTMLWVVGIAAAAVLALFLFRKN